jgi:hypothetical protein
MAKTKKMINQIVKIYRINKNYYRFQECNSNSSILQIAVKTINEKRPVKDRVEFEDLSTFEESGLKYYLFVHKHKEKKSDWFSFLPTSLTSNWDFNQQHISIILFIDNGIDIFIVIGGNGFQQVVKIIDHTFGLRLLSKVISPNEDKILSINTRGLTGTRSGLSEQYRDEIRVADFAKFGKLPTEAHLTLSQKITDEYFGFLKSKPNEKIKIHVGKSFKVKKSLTFDELKKLVTELGHIMELEEQEYLSSFIQESNHKLINENFQPLLINAIFNDFANKKRNNTNYTQSFKFDFCNPNKIIEFYSADRYILTEKSGDSCKSFAETNNKSEIYDLVLKRLISEFPGETKLFDFQSFIRGLRVRAYQDGKISCSSSFLFHFTSEFSFDGQTVFLVDNKWYRLKNSFLKELNAECLSMLKRNKLSSGVFNLQYNSGESEYEYNLRYHNHDNYYVFDTITPQGIEMCDVLFTNEETTYLIHVKKGFDNSMRELTNQISLSARRLTMELKSEGREYLHALWESYSKKYPAKAKIKFEEFLTFFDRKVVYVLAFISQRADNASIIDFFDRYKSNIAKYSLLDCGIDLQEYRYELNICQIIK